MSKLETAYTRYVEKVKAMFPEAFSTWVEPASGVSYFAVLPCSPEYEEHSPLGKGITEFLAWQNAANILPQEVSDERFLSIG